MNVDIALGGVALILLVPALVAGAEVLGMDPKWAAWLALGLALTGALLAQLVLQYPGIESWVYAVVGGLVIWLASIGVIELGTKFGKSQGFIKEKPEEPPSV